MDCGVRLEEFCEASSPDAIRVSGLSSRNSLCYFRTTVLSAPRTNQMLQGAHGYRRADYAVPEGAPDKPRGNTLIVRRADEAKPLSAICKHTSEGVSFFIDLRAYDMQLPEFTAIGRGNAPNRRFVRPRRIS